MIKNRTVALIFRLASLVLILAGLVPILFTANGFGQYMYYTIQSNLLALVLFVLLTIKTIKGLRKDGSKGGAGYFARFEMVCTVDLLLTLVVYWVLLAPQAFSMSSDHTIFNFRNLAVHLFTPLLCFIDYILFTESDHLKYRDVYAVLVFPLSYALFASIAGMSGYVYRISTVTGLPEHFPYFFLDFQKLGGKVFLYIGGLVVFFLILSHLLYLFDKKVKKPVLIGNSAP